MDLADVIRTRRAELGLTLEEVGNATGVGRSTVRKWELGIIKNMRRDKLAKLADVLHLDPLMLMQASGETASGSDDDIFEYANIMPLVPRRIPLLGNVAAGEPVLAESDIMMYLPSNEPIRCDFALTVKGDSMSPTYKNGDIVYVRKRPTVDDGQIAVVLIGDDATLKHVYKRKGGITLTSDNPDFLPMHYDEFDCEQVRIVGIPVAFFRKV